MSWLPSWEGFLVALVVMTTVRAVWIWRKFDDHRVLRFIGWPEPYGSSGRREYFWSGTSGASRAEIERALSPEYVKKYGRLMAPGARKAIIVANVLAWALVVYGGFGLPVNLGLDDSHLSWWGVLPIITWWLARTSARAIADAPEELLDERLLAIRNNSYYEAYRLIGMFVSAMVVLAIAIDIAGTDRTLSLADTDWTSMIITIPFVSIWALSTLPSLVLISRQAFD